MFQCIDEVGDMREGISVFDGMQVDVMIVLAGTEHVIFLQNKEEGRHLQGFEGNDLALLQVFINEHF